MKPKLLFGLALVLSGGLLGCSKTEQTEDDFVDNRLSSTSGGQSFDSLLADAFPGKKFRDIRAVHFQKLPLSQRNKIALAAASELSLRTTNGLVITAETVDKLLPIPEAHDTATEAVLRRQYWRDAERVELLRDLVSANLINDPGVIEPLINMLDCPGVHAGIPSLANQALGELTKRTWGENYAQWDNRGSRHQLVAWWRDWWSKNNNKHPVCDSDMDEMVKARIAAIESQLRKDVTNYSELRYLKPESINLSHLEPYHEEFVDMGVDSSMLQQVVFRTASDGKIRFGTEDDYIYLCITAKFATPPPVPHLAETAKRWQALRKEVLREVLPGTDIVITVEAASKDSEFMREVRDSLEKLKYRQP